MLKMASKVFLAITFLTSKKILHFKNGKSFKVTETGTIEFFLLKICLFPGKHRDSNPGLQEALKLGVQILTGADVIKLKRLEPRLLNLKSLSYSEMIATFLVVL